MAIKVEVAGRNMRNQPYPGLYTDPEERLILLLIEPGVGTVIEGGATRYSPGYFGRNWYMTRLEPFLGRVTLENK